MHIVFCSPHVTSALSQDAERFFDSCRIELSNYLTNVFYLHNEFNLSKFLAESNGEGIILAFFLSKDDNYSEKMLRLITLCNNNKSIIWPIAMQKDYRMPPDLIQKYQSFDVASQIENRKLVSENIKTIAFVFARKIISQSLPTLYYDKCRYFISHRRKDGESIAGKLADKINLLSRYRRGYRDVVEVEVGMEAQDEIDKALLECDALIFLQTPEAHDSEYIKKELYFALLHSIPILWIQIDNSDKLGFKFIPADNPNLCYKSTDFDDETELEKIANTVEEQCFYLIMNSSGSVYNYIEELKYVAQKYLCNIDEDKDNSLAYFLHYKKQRADYYEDGVVKQYIQYYGRNPKEEDKQVLRERIGRIENKPNSAVLLSSTKHHNRVEGILFEDNYEDYLLNLEEKLGEAKKENNRKIIISGAFPDCDEIYKFSLSEALILYAKEIIRKGYILVFGAHPTFQEIIFKIGEIYSVDSRQYIHMYISEAFLPHYDITELNKKAKIIVTKRGDNISESLTTLRKEMILESNSEAMICMGGKIKMIKSEQGVDEEVEIAITCNMPVFLVGSVGGRSSQYANELMVSDNWSYINDAESCLNEALIYDINHRKMIRRVLSYLERKN